MKRFVSIGLSVFIFFCMLIATERAAYGYVDPGSGLVALQSAAAIAAGFGYILRRRIKSLFARPTDESKAVATGPAKKEDSAKAV